MKNKEDEQHIQHQNNYMQDIHMNPSDETLSSNRPDADVADFEYGNSARTLLNSTLDWNDQDKIAKRI
jgi:hypothetical protein